MSKFISETDATVKGFVLFLVGVAFGLGFFTRSMWHEIGCADEIKSAIQTEHRELQQVQIKLQEAKDNYWHGYENGFTKGVSKTLKGRKVKP